MKLNPDVDKNFVRTRQNHPIWSNSHPSATANEGRGMGTNPTETAYDLKTYEAVLPTDDSENYSSGGMLVIWIKVQTVCISSNNFACKYT